MSSTTKHLFTVADLDAFPEDDGNRYELIEGELFVSRAPGLPHQLVLNNLQVELGIYLKNNPIGVFVPGAGAVFSDYDAVTPDLVFVSHERWNKVVANERFIAAPNLVIEILSPENRTRDLTAKHSLYAKYEVEEYWVVDPENRSVLISCLEGNTFKLTRTVGENENVTSDILPGLLLPVTSIFTL